MFVAECKMPWWVQSEHMRNKLHKELRTYRWCKEIIYKAVLAIKMTQATRFVAVRVIPDSLYDHMCPYLAFFALLLRHYEYVGHRHILNTAKDHSVPDQLPPVFQKDCLHQWLLATAKDDPQPLQKMTWILSHCKRWRRFSLTRSGMWALLPRFTILCATLSFSLKKKKKPKPALHLLGIQLRPISLQSNFPFADVVFQTQLSWWSEDYVDSV